MPTPAETVARLAAVGVDASVAPADLLAWLGDPAYTPYPAIAQALLTLLGERRFVQPVHVDVVVYDYEARAASPRAVTDVDPAVLRAAVLEASNERNGTTVASVEELLTPPPPPPPSPVQVKWEQLGGAAGFLGAPVGTERATPDGAGLTRDFAGGSIAWHPSVGAFAVGGAIGARWRELGREAWGFPVTDETATPDTVGRYNHFRAVHLPGTPEASIYWTGATGAHEVVGGIRERWAALGWENGVGYPLGPEGPRMPGGGRVQPFQRNVIGWTVLDGAFLGHVTLKATWSTETALGGDASLELSHDGSYRFLGRARNTGAVDYEYRVRAAVGSSGGPVITAQHSGEVDGALIGDGDTATWDEPGTSALLAQEFPTLRPETFAVSKEWDTGGIIGDLASVAEDVVTFFVTSAVAGPGVAVAVLVATELGRVTGTSLLGVGGLTGTIVSAGATMLLGPGFAVPLFVGTLVATDLLVRQRTISAEEYAFADVVFRGTLPPREKITLTNTAGLSGRPFTAPNADDGVLVNLGDEAFSFPGGPMFATSARYPVPGQLLVHELTHAWQLACDGFIPGYVCRGASKSDYRPPAPGTPWGEFDLEQQAATVDEWFLRNAVQPAGTPNAGTPWTTTADLATLLTGRPALADPYFGYVDEKVRLRISS